MIMDSRTKYLTLKVFYFLFGIASLGGLFSCFFLLLGGLFQWLSIGGYSYFTKIDFITTPIASILFGIISIYIKHGVDKMEIENEEY